jgi:hypothetical protein
LNPPSDPEGKSFVSPTRTNDSGSQAPTISRGTKRDSSYDQLSPVINLGDDNDTQIDELILNASMNEVLGGSSDDYSSFYKDLKSFMIKVFFLFPFMPTLRIIIFTIFTLVPSWPTKLGIAFLFFSYSARLFSLHSSMTVSCLSSI